MIGVPNFEPYLSAIDQLDIYTMAMVNSQSVAYRRHGRRHGADSMTFVMLSGSNKSSASTFGARLMGDEDPPNLGCSKTKDIVVIQMEILPQVMALFMDNHGTTMDFLKFETNQA